MLSMAALVILRCLFLFARFAMLDIISKSNVLKVGMLKSLSYARGSVP